MKNLFLLLVISVSLSLYGSDFDQNCKLARSNDTAKLKPLLADTKTINATDEHGKTLLFCAVDYGAYKIRIERHYSICLNLEEESILMI